MPEECPLQYGLLLLIRLPTHTGHRQYQQRRADEAHDMSTKTRRVMRYLPCRQRPTSTRTRLPPQAERGLSQDLGTNDGPVSARERTRTRIQGWK